MSRWGSGEAGAVVSVTGGVDVPRLIAAFQGVVKRHEVLRTSLITVGELGLPLQVVGDESVMRLELGNGESSVENFRIVGPCVAVDSVSFESVVGELAALYGGGEMLGDAVQYVDYAGWLGELLDDGDTQDRRAFWGIDTGSPGSVEALGFRSASGRTARRRLAVAVAEVDVLLAWSVLLSARFTGEDFGAEVWIRGDGRCLPELKGAVGPYSRWLPLGMLPDGHESMGGLRDRLAERLEAMRSHEMFFVGGVARPGFGFSFERWPVASGGGLVWSVEEMWRECEGFGLVLRIAETTGRLDAWLEFDEDEWPTGEAERLLTQLVQVVGRLADADIAVVSGADLLSPDAPVVAGTPVMGEGVLGSVLRAARETPGRVAVECEGRAWRYGELVERARRVAAAVGVVTGGRRGARVGLCVGQSSEGVAALLGVWGAGAVAVLLEPTAPEGRLAAQVAGAELTALVSGERAGTMAGWHGPRLDVTGGSALWAGPVSGAWAEPGPDDPAYVMFTSGSTGAPKGVEVTHRALGAYAAALRERVAAGGGERWELVTTLAADLGYTSVLGALTSAGTLVVRTPEEATDWRAVGGCDYLKITPGHVEALLAAAGDDAVSVLPGKGLLIGGETWGWDLWERLRELRTGLDVWNHYGPTETTIGVAAGRVARTAGAAAPMLGQPLGHVWLYVLDRRGDPVLHGAAGQLWVGGAAVARGYVNQPATTADRFRPDPWGPFPGGRMYGTGDLVRRASDGALQFLGRIDTQLKIRGHRVEPGEIEAALRDHPAIGNAAVVGSSAADGRTRLEAYLTGSSQPRPDLAELKGFLADRLPNYMIPGSFVWMPELPRLPNGKLDRARVLEATGDHAPPEQPYEQPRPRAEATLAEVWAATLRLPRVGRLDNFFALGGDSIASIQVVARAREAGLEITVEQIFRHPTLAELAKVATVGAPDAFERARSGPVPLTPIQRWFFAEHGPEPHHYNQAFWLRATEPLDQAALEQAFASLVERHDALRLRFVPSLNGWDQELVDAPGPVTVEVIDLADVPDPDADAVATTAAARLQASLNLGRPPLMRAALFRFGERDHRLLWIAHHLIVDVVSWTVLFEQLQRAYLHVFAGETVDVGLATAPFAQWARCLAAKGPKPAAGAGGGEWVAPVGRDAGYPVAQGLPRPHGVAGDAATLHRSFTEELTRDLLDVVCPAYGLQPLEVVLGLLVDGVATWSGDDSVLVDMEWHGRDGVPDAPDVSRTVGWFTARTPLLLTRPSANSPDTLLKEVKEQVRRHARRRLEYGLLRWASESSEVAAKLAALPPPDISFNFLGQVDRRFPTGSPFTSFAEAGPGSRAASTPRRFRFEVNAAVAGGHLEIDWSYSPLVDDAGSIDRLLKGMRDSAGALADACRHVDRVYTPSDFEGASLTQSDLDRLLQQWNKSSRDP